MLDCYIYELFSRTDRNNRDVITNYRFSEQLALCHLRYNYLALSSSSRTEYRTMCLRVLHVCTVCGNYPKTMKCTSTIRLVEFGLRPIGMYSRSACPHLRRLMCTTTMAILQYRY